MKDLEFPVFKTKSPKGSPKFNLSDPKERAKYFQFKAGPEIAKLKQYLKNNTFLAMMLGKKAAGKGTYTKFFIEALNTKKATHLSAGDIVRGVHRLLKTPQGKAKLVKYLEQNYRGYLSIDEGIEAILSRSQDRVSVPDELMLALFKREIDLYPDQALFVDGFPRTLDQVSYSLFFRDLVGHRDDPDFFVLIDIALQVIDARLKNRVVCPLCQQPYHTKFYPSSKVGHDQKTGQFYFICDNHQCRGARTVEKEGDELGIGPIQKRLEADEKLLIKAFHLHGIPKILLRNTIPLKKVSELVDDYERTFCYSYSWDEKAKKVMMKKDPWVVKDDQGEDSVVLSGPPMAVSLIKQLADIL